MTSKFLMHAYDINMFMADILVYDFVPNDIQEMTTKRFTC